MFFLNKNKIDVIIQFYRVITFDDVNSVRSEYAQFITNIDKTKGLFSQRTNNYLPTGRGVGPQVNKFEQVWEISMW